MKIKPGKSKAIRFRRARGKKSTGYSDGGQKISEASSCKYLEIILRRNLNCVDQVNYTVQKAWKAHRFVMRVLKKGNGIQINLTYMSVARPILEYGSARFKAYSGKRAGTPCIRQVAKALIF